MSSAILSDCGLYRYRLDRDVCAQFEGSKVIAYFGINPSTADALINDQTVRKWIGFTLANGGHRFIAGNVFGYRSKDVKVLALQDDPFGPEWLGHLNAIIAEADILVPCWGRLNKTPKSLRGAPAQLMESLLRSGKPVLHFGKTQCGQPKHPQMLAYATPLTPWCS